MARASVSVCVRVLLRPLAFVWLVARLHRSFSCSHTPDGKTNTTAYPTVCLLPCIRACSCAGIVCVCVCVCACSWNDPDALIGSSQGTAVHLTQAQSRAQMSLWSTMAAPLEIGSNILNLSDYDLETYKNTEV